MTGVVYHIVRGSLHDGPGVRTVVYLKGCPLRCRWCHNPEGQTFAPVNLFYPEKCLGCGTCSEICPTHAGKEGCPRCLLAADRCPAKALEPCGRRYTPQEIIAILEKDKPYYGSNGGVTFSGGECLCQPAFLEETLLLCRKQNILTAIETSLYAPRQVLERVLPLTNFLLCDVKLADPASHKAATGRSNRLILSNLAFACQRHENVTVRVPIIPSQTDDEDNLLGIANIANGLGPGLKKVVLLRYNRMAKSKYQRLNRRYQDFGEQTEEDFARCAAIMRPLLRVPLETE